MSHYETGAERTNSTPVDSGAIGRLNEAEREILRDMAGCGCCSSLYSIDKAMPDACPRDGEYVDHSCADDCNQMIPIDQVVERIVREHTDRALAEALADIRTRRQVFNRLGAHEQYLMALDDAFGLVNNRLAIVRAARQEQGHG